MNKVENKVQYNIKNTHYAVMSDDGTYGTPVPIPGAVSLSLEAQGELSNFYADGDVYFTSSSNGGYQGDFEFARIPDSFRQAVLKEISDNNKVLIENTNAQPAKFALGFQIDGNIRSTLFWFLNCTCTRPSVESSTNEESIEPQTETLDISCAPNENGDIRAKTTADTTDDIVSAWFGSVYERDKTTGGV